MKATRGEAIRALIRQCQATAEQVRKTAETMNKLGVELWQVQRWQDQKFKNAINKRKKLR